MSGPDGLTQYLNPVYGNSWTFGRFASQEMRLALAAIQWAAYEMRQSMIAQSQQNELNASGESEGWNGDHFKLGGARAADMPAAPHSSPRHSQPRKSARYYLISRAYRRPTPSVSLRSAQLTQIVKPRESRREPAVIGGAYK